MDWPGRGPGVSQASQAWMFATPEEMLGKRVFRDGTAWENVPAPEESETLFLEFTNNRWSFGTDSENQRDKKQSQDKDFQIAAPPVQMHNRVKGRRKLAATSTPGQNGHSNNNTVQVTDLALFRVQSKRTGKKLQQPKPQEASTQTESNKPNGNAAINTMSKNPPQETSAKTKRRKKKAKLIKAAHDAMVPDADVHMDKTESVAQKIADSPTSLMLVSNNGAKDNITPKTASTIINRKTKSQKIYGTRQEPGETLSNTASIQDCVSLFELVKGVVDGYRMQSALHFALHIDVQLADHGHKLKHDASKSELNITFQNYSQEFYWLCKRHLKKGFPVRKIMVRTAKWPVPLCKLLAEQFPASGALTSKDTLRQYWNSNGKSFDWTNLPTELKEHVIQFCIVTAPSHPDYFHDFKRVGKYKAMPNARSCELVDRLGQWKSLLRVSTQVRAITLRLCFTGSLFFGKGLCITSHNLSDFSNRIANLERFTNVLEPNSVPRSQDDIGHFLSATYRDAPKLYPELKRYGDFSQEIRKVNISFDFISFYRFFHVTAGGFGKEYQPHAGLTYKVFEKMPHLNEIVIRLPTEQKHQWTNKTYQLERPLFHDTSPCLRMIFRILYERIAEALAAYETISVKNFLDDAEEERFFDLRQTAIRTLKSTPPPQPLKLALPDLQDLGTQDGGGIPLTKEEVRQARHERDERLFLQQKTNAIEHQPGSVVDGEPDEDPFFYPIRCRCDVPCLERYVFNTSS